MSRFTRSHRSIPSPPFLRSRARGLFLGGHTLFLLAVEDMLLRLGESPSPEALLYLEHFTGSLASALVLLWLGILGMDLAERRLFPKE